MVSEFEATVNMAEEALSVLYETLTNLAAGLDPAGLADPDDPTLSESMASLGQQMALSAIHQHVLMARHEIHGGLTRVIAARIEITRSRS